jgi:acetyl esterase/lipase
MARQWHRRLRQAGAVADLHVYEGLVHGDYAFQHDTPECAERYRENSTLSCCTIYLRVVLKPADSGLSEVSRGCWAWRVLRAMAPQAPP